MTKDKNIKEEKPKKKINKVTKIKDDKKNIEIKKEKIKLKKYSLGEELMSAITHGIGAALSVTALVLCIVAGAKGGAINVVSGIIYGV